MKHLWHTMECPSDSVLHWPLAVGYADDFCIGQDPRTKFGKSHLHKLDQRV